LCRECGCEEALHEENCGCGCGTAHHRHKSFHARRFLTKEEKIKKLQDYAEDLKRELAAVEERIKELGK